MGEGSCSRQGYDFDADISVDAPPPEVIVDSSLILSDDDYATSEEYTPGP